MTRLHSPTLALLFVAGFAAPAAADDPPGFAERMVRIGRLPAELVKAKKTDAEIVDGLFLAAVARLPTDKEKETAAKHLAGAKNREESARDIAWAVVNTKEFLKLQGLDTDAAAAVRLLNKHTEKWGKTDKEKN